MDTISRAGFADVELVWAVDVFKGAGGEGSASSFETMGVNIRGHKPRAE